MFWTLGMHIVSCVLFLACLTYLAAYLCKHLRYLHILIVNLFMVKFALSFSFFTGVSAYRVIILRWYAVASWFWLSWMWCMCCTVEQWSKHKAIHMLCSWFWNPCVCAARKVGVGYLDCVSHSVISFFIILVFLTCQGQSEEHPPCDKRVHAHTHAHMHTHAHTCTWMHAHACTHTCTHVHTHVYQTLYHKRSMSCKLLSPSSPLPLSQTFPAFLFPWRNELSAWPSALNVFAFSWHSVLNVAAFSFFCLSILWQQIFLVCVHFFCKIHLWY